MDQDRLYYSLTDAAEILGLKNADLLHYGARGKISLMVAVPEQLITTQWKIKLQLGQVNVSQEEIKPQFLVLKPSYCMKVEANRETLQSEFPYGYYISDSNGENKQVERHLSPTYPGMEGDSEEDPVYIWATIGKSRGSHSWNHSFPETNGASPDIGSPVLISQSNLLVPRQSLNKFSDELQEKKAKEGITLTKKKERAIQSSLDPAIFSNLAILVKAAEKMWGNADANERESHPTNEYVETYLKEEGFSKHMASVGASIIRPDYAPKGRKKDDEK